MPNEELRRQIIRGKIMTEDHIRGLIGDALLLPAVEAHWIHEDEHKADPECEFCVKVETIDDAT